MAPASPRGHVQNLTSTWLADQIGGADAMHPPGPKPWANMETNRVVSTEVTATYPYMYIHIILNKININHKMFS